MAKSRYMRRGADGNPVRMTYHYKRGPNGEMLKVYDTPKKKGKVMAKKKAAKKKAAKKAAKKATKRATKKKGAKKGGRRTSGGG